MLADLISVIGGFVGLVGGSIGIVLGALKLREVVQRPRLDVRWNWSWDGDRVSSVGFYFVNETSKPAHIEHFAFRHLLNEASKPAEHGAARFRLAGSTCSSSRRPRARNFHSRWAQTASRK